MTPGSAETDRTDAQFCWEKLLRVRPLFRLSFPYAPGEISEQLLALHALFAAVEESVSGVSDENVSKVKLAWWQQQLLTPEFALSAHPITRKLQRSGALPAAVRGDVEGLLATAFHRVDLQAPANEQQLEQLCRKIGLYPLRLELSLHGDSLPEDAPLAAACAVDGLVQLLRESSRSRLTAYNWVPMNLMAKFELSRTDMQNELQDDTPARSRSARSAGLMRHLCMLGESWTGDEPASPAARAGASPFDAAWRRRHRHWIIQRELNGALLKKLRGLPAARHARAFSRAGPADALRAWRSARRYTRGVGTE